MEGEWISKKLSQRKKVVDHLYQVVASLTFMEVIVVEMVTVEVITQVGQVNQL